MYQLGHKLTIRSKAVVGYFSKDANQRKGSLLCVNCTPDPQIREENLPWFGTACPPGMGGEKQRFLRKVWANNFGAYALLPLSKALA